MVALPVLFIALLFIGCRFAKNEEFLSFRQTTSINGLFCICVFFRHILNFAQYTSTADYIAFRIDAYWGQLVVVPFLFFSGYGISESIKNKPFYVKQIPLKKILKTWLMFALYILIWVGIKIPLGIFYSPSQVLLAMTAWYSLGNLSWYIFAILALWLGTFISFSIFKKGIKPYVAMVVYTLIYAVVIRYFGRETKWYDTVIAYNIGLFVSYFKPYLKKVYDNSFVWSILTAVSAIMLVLISVFLRNSIILMAVKTGLLSAFLILLSMRMKIGNPVSYWLGKNLIGMYLMQNIAMLLLARIDYLKEHPYIYTAACIMLTVVLAWLFITLFELLWKNTFGRLITK